MIWLKSIFAGVAAALLTLVAIVIATTTWVVSISRGAGSGGIGAVSTGVIELVVLPVVLAFAVGFLWMFRRQRRRNRQ
jgi:hypothetical protein